MCTDQAVNPDTVSETNTQELADHIEPGKNVILVYSPRSRTISMECDGFQCHDIREFKVVATTHSGAELVIRSRDKTEHRITWHDNAFVDPALCVTMRLLTESEKEA